MLGKWRMGLQRDVIVFAGLLIIALWVVVVPVPAAELTISNTGPTAIQDGIDYLQTHSLDTTDTLILNPGTYYENDIVVKKNIIIRAATGSTAANTIIDAQMLGRVFDNTGGYDLTIRNLTLQNGFIADDGGAIHSRGGSLLIMSSTISNCSVNNPADPGRTRGGAIYTYHGTDTITDTTFTRCSADYGGAIYLRGDALDIRSSRFSDCKANHGDGGAIYSTGATTVKISGTTFTTCTASDFGGAIHSSDGTLEIDSTVFTGCHAMCGGAVNTEGPSATIGPGTRFSGCTASKDGGAIYSASDVDISSATFAECAAGTGGAIYNRNGGDLSIDGSTFTNTNGISVDGGAIYNDEGTVGISGSSFSGFRAGNGGAINTHGGEVTIDTSDFFDCSSQRGGAVYADRETRLEILRSAFLSCSAAEDGGAIAMGGPNRVIVEESIFSDCWATRDGGAIFGDLGSSLTLTSSSITGCQATFGSAIHGRGVNMHYCRIYHNGGNAVNTTDGDLSDNWWGKNSGPASGDVTSGPDLKSWLVLGITTDHDTLIAGQTAYVPANLTYDSIGGYHDPAMTLGHLPDNIPVFFTVTRGTGSVLPVAGGTESGMNTTAYTSASGTVAMVNATVDGESVGVWINVNGAAFTGTPTSGSAPLAVQFTDASVGSPTMWNWSFGDGQWFNTTDVAAASPSHTYTSTGTYTVSLTITGAFGTHTLTRAGYIVVGPVTAPTAPVVTLDTSNNDDGFPTPTASPVPTGEGTLPPMTVTVNIGGDSKAWQAVVTGTKLSELIVTGTVQPGPGSNLTAPPGIVYQFISLVPARYTSITHAVIFFTVPQSWLDENHIDTKSIVLYHQTANGWEALPTTVVSTKDGTVYFSAESAGFSLFAIAGTPTVLTPAVTSVATSGSVVEERATTRATVTKAPVTTQTTAPPAASPQPAAPSPLLNIVLVIAAIGILAGGGFMVRRWWIQRQNPALFVEYD
jgi:predicted outer membrane repeat protein